MILHNKLSRKDAITLLENETFKRITISFYRYIKINNPKEFRDEIYLEWWKLGCFGRIYVAREGINAQMSIPAHNLHIFLALLGKTYGLEKMPIKYAVDNGNSFYKLTIKVKPKIVADGLDDDTYDVTRVGNHLSPMEFHSLSGGKDVITIDMRNHYESEVGRFESAYCPDADTFRDAIHMVEQKYSNQKNKKILLYCTGGIRCEKASAYLKHRGYKDVNQLHGGIIAYANELKSRGVESKFIGKNFVFDERLGESIDGKVISRCHQCGAPCDNHTNCANNDCHLLFIQCPNCADKYSGCCTEDCQAIIQQPLEKQKEYRRIRHQKYASSKIFKSRLRPDLKKIMFKKEI